MTLPPDQDKASGPTGRTPLLRRTLWNVWALAAALSPGLAVLGLCKTGLLAHADVPPGRVEAVLGQTKRGVRVRTDGGRVAVVPKAVLRLQPEPVALSVGDRLEKRRDSLTYVVNGVPLTDGKWVARHWLFSRFQLAAMGVYVVLGMILVHSEAVEHVGGMRGVNDLARRMTGARRWAEPAIVLSLIWLGVFFVMALGAGCVTASRYAIFRGD